jgi:microcystin-dependent protein
LALPSGLIFPYGGSRAPDGYLFCQGQSLSTAQYQNLFDAIGYSYGGSGASFNLPDLQGRVPVGLGTNADVNALTDNDGIATVANRTPRHTHVVPKHKHSVSVSGTTNNTDVNHEHGSGDGYPFITGGFAGAGADVSTGGGGYRQQYSGGMNRNNPHSHTFSAAGTAGSTSDPSGDSDLTSGSAGPPFIVVNYIIKT